MNLFNSVLENVTSRIFLCIQLIYHYLPHAVTTQVDSFGS
jgi:hypothetical protein